MLLNTKLETIWCWINTLTHAQPVIGPVLVIKLTGN
jgi:hypothetical protein